MLLHLYRREPLFCDFLAIYSFFREFLRFFGTIYVVWGYKSGRFWTPEAPSGYKSGKILRVQTGVMAIGPLRGYAGVLTHAAGADGRDLSYLMSLPYLVVAIYFRIIIIRLVRPARITAMESQKTAFEMQKALHKLDMLLQNIQDCR